MPQVYDSGSTDDNGQDIDRGYGSVCLPFALERKYPNADCQWIWQYVFPAVCLPQDPRSGVTRRHHLYETGVQRAVRDAVKLVRVQKRVTCHTFRHREWVILALHVKIG